MAKTIYDLTRFTIEKKKRESLTFRLPFHAGQPQLRV